ncbi:hypothetical protein CDAR_576341 [Caerostris darwini]|uniref:Uncharacterized protein n=1 Tax=Caerostris darwini TaxID=1538125 RepID=A0AAV4V7Z8_9ARAC|nr:hypothetical protein CDAR_576341 [Caerostris darwini]
MFPLFLFDVSFPCHVVSLQQLELRHVPAIFGCQTDVKTWEFVLFVTLKMGVKKIKERSFAVTPYLKSVGPALFIFAMDEASKKNASDQSSLVILAPVFRGSVVKAAAVRELPSMPRGYSTCRCVFVWNLFLLQY